MRKTLLKNVYTQINTNPTAYLIQNLSKYKLGIIVSDVPPGSGESSDFILEGEYGISNNHIEGICWGKPYGKTVITVGLAEG